LPDVKKTVLVDDLTSHLLVPLAVVYFLFFFERCGKGGRDIISKRVREREREREREKERLAQNHVIVGRNKHNQGKLTSGGTAFQSRHATLGSQHVPDHHRKEEGYRASCRSIQC
jgi:hypothetical protein